ncbi:solute carrier family 35 member b1 [Anaeramoeba flamelloides]|uniref:Solute carrier family 35 member b1 n=1 Tax=Anaeramoeba flamelloides TaxID=1746091 RepID=A0AAV7YY30_9EUKA|nr:solute carrier family 35 member b1 [Anaeramoeba flamelloides]
MVEYAKKKIVSLIFTILGIYVTWTLYSLSLEKILYGDWVGGKFYFPLTLIITNSTIGYLISSSFQYLSKRFFEAQDLSKNKTTLLKDNFGSRGSKFGIKNVNGYGHENENENENANENENENSKVNSNINANVNEYDSENENENGYGVRSLDGNQKVRLMKHKKEYRNENLGTKLLQNEKLVAESTNIPYLKFFFVSFMQTISYVSGVIAFNYTNYPLQILVKSCKPISILLLGSLFYKKKYPISRYATIVVMCGGIALFSSQQNLKKSKSENIMLSLILLSLALFSDGLYSQHLDHLHKQYPSNSVFRSMNWVNFWLIVCVLPIWLFNTKERTHFIPFIQENPMVIYLLILSGFLAGIGQIFIYLCLKNFDSLVVSVITTTRKFLTILLSIIYFKHPLTTKQWFSVFLVFGSLLIDIMLRENVFIKLKNK